jgi:hypothetical protein
MAIWNPRQIAAQNIDGERGSHEDGSYPEAPVTMHPSPVRAGIGFANAVAVAFGVMLVSSHCFSISDEYSPQRAALSFESRRNSKLFQAPITGPIALIHRKQALLIGEGQRRGVFQQMRIQQNLLASCSRSL